MYIDKRTVRRGDCTHTRGGSGTAREAQRLTPNEACGHGSTGHGHQSPPGQRGPVRDHASSHPTNRPSLSVPPASNRLSIAGTGPLVAVPRNVGHPFCPCVPSRATRNTLTNTARSPPRTLCHPRFLHPHHDPRRRHTSLCVHPCTISVAGGQ